MRNERDSVLVDERDKPLHERGIPLDVFALDDTCGKEPE